MHIAEPCHESWDRMTPAAEGRHCAACTKTVVDLSVLPPAARREKLGEISQQVAAGERVCVRGRIDRDGMLAGSRRVLTGGMAAILAMTIAGCVGAGPEMAAPTQQANQVAGGVRATTGEATVTPVPAGPYEQPMGIAAPPLPVVPKQPVPREVMGDVMAPPQPVKMGGMVCPVAVSATAVPVSATAAAVMGSPAPAPAPITMGKIKLASPAPAPAR